MALFDRYFISQAIHCNYVPILYCFRDIHCSKKRILYPTWVTLFNAPVQRDLSEFMRDLYVAEIYGRGTIFLPLYAPNSQ